MYVTFILRFNFNCPKMALKRLGRQTISTNGIWVTAKGYERLPYVIIILKHLYFFVVFIVRVE